jgi:hypothetical protein
MEAFYGIITVVGLVLNIIMWFGITPKQVGDLPKSRLIRNKNIIAPIIGNASLVVFAILWSKDSQAAPLGFTLRICLMMALFYLACWMIYIRSIAEYRPRIYATTGIVNSFYPLAYELMILWAVGNYTSILGTNPLTKAEYIAIWIIGGILVVGFLILGIWGTTKVLGEYRISKRLNIGKIDINKLIESARKD